MSRAGYSDDLENWDLIRWRGAVTSSIRGKRGQAFLQEMLTALDSIADKRLIDKDLEKDGEVCALGAVGRARGLDMSNIDPEDYGGVADSFGIPHSLAREIEYVNDEYGYKATPEKRFEIVRKWAVSNLKSVEAERGEGR